MDELESCTAEDGVISRFFFFFSGRDFFYVSGVNLRDSFIYSDSSFEGFSEVLFLFLFAFFGFFEIYYISRLLVLVVRNFL